jgi:hypothetical protein
MGMNCMCGLAVGYVKKISVVAVLVVTIKKCGLIRA